VAVAVTIFEQNAASNTFRSVLDATPGETLVKILKGTLDGSTVRAMKSGLAQLLPNNDNDEDDDLVSVISTSMFYFNKDDPSLWIYAGGMDDETQVKAAVGKILRVLPKESEKEMTQLTSNSRVYKLALDRVPSEETKLAVMKNWDVKAAETLSRFRVKRCHFYIPLAFE
jgi:hypothetical protein